MSVANDSTRSQQCYTEIPPDAPHRPRSIHLPTPEHSTGSKAAYLGLGPRYRARTGPECIVNSPLSRQYSSEQLAQVGEPRSSTREDTVDRISPLPRVFKCGDVPSGATQPIADQHSSNNYRSFVRRASTASTSSTSTAYTAASYTSHTRAQHDSWRTSWTSYTSIAASDKEPRNRVNIEELPLSPAAKEVLSVFEPIRELDLTMSIERKVLQPRPGVSEALRRLNAAAEWSDDEAQLDASDIPQSNGGDAQLVDEIRRAGLPTEAEAARFRAAQRAAPACQQISFPSLATSPKHRSRADSVDSLASWHQHRPPTPTFRPPSVLPTLEDADTASIRTPVSEAFLESGDTDGDKMDTASVFDERQKIAYVALCYLILARRYTGKAATGMETKACWASAMNFSRQLLRRLYLHMDISTEEQKMIENMSAHSVQPEDVARTLIVECTQVTVPVTGRCKLVDEDATITGSDTVDPSSLVDEDQPDSDSQSSPSVSSKASTPTKGQSVSRSRSASSSSANSEVVSEIQTTTMDARWSVVADLFLLIISESQYDARARVHLKEMASCLELDWDEFVRLERRVAEQLRINDEVAETMKHEIRDSEARNRSGRGRRWALVGLATLGGGLILGLSAGLLAPAIGSGLVAGLASIGVSGTSAFLAHTGGMALITTGGVLTGSGMAGTKMHKRTRGIRVFQFHPLLDQRRVNVVLCVSGWLTCEEDVWLPFSVLDQSIGDQYCLCWEPKLLHELGSTLKILAGELLSQAVQTVLAHTTLATLMAGLAWPLALTKLGYLVDNPWSIGLDRARKAGLILADTLLHRNQGFRPVTLCGYSLGARVIFYCLVELARVHAFGVIEDVFLFGTPITATREQWEEAASVVSGRFVNCYHQKDWVLGFLYRVGARQPVAGLTALEGVRGLENVNVTFEVHGHLGYRVAMPRMLKKMGFVVTAEEFQEPETEEERVEREAEEQAKAARKRQSLLVDMELQRAMAELRASGCKVREIKSTLPALGDQDSVSEKTLAEEDTSLQSGSSDIR